MTHEEAQGFARMYFDPSDEAFAKCVGAVLASHAPSQTTAQPTLTLECVKCGKKYDPEGWDPMGGDCSIVRDLITGEVIRPPNIEHNHR